MRAYVFAYYYITSRNQIGPSYVGSLDLTNGLRTGANALELLRRVYIIFYRMYPGRTSEGKSAKPFWQRDLIYFAFQRIKSGGP